MNNKFQFASLMLNRYSQRSATAERWLREEVVASYDAYQKNPDQVFSVDEVRRRVAETLKKYKKKR
jgi:hypothetical protein